MNEAIEQELIASRANLEDLAFYLTQDHESAKELYQETVFRIWNNRDSYSAGTDFLAWSRTIMVNRFRSEYRMRRRRQDLLSMAGSLSYLYQDGSSWNTGEWLLFSAEVEECIDRLDEKFSRPLRMRSEGHPYCEITEVMGLGMNTLKSRIHIGRKKLREIMK